VIFGRPDPTTKTRLIQSKRTSLALGMKEANQRAWYLD
jgi:hypothetical protein